MPAIGARTTAGAIASAPSFGGGGAVVVGSSVLVTAPRVGGDTGWSPLPPWRRAADGLGPQRLVPPAALAAGPVRSGARAGRRVRRRRARPPARWRGPAGRRRRPGARTGPGSPRRGTPPPAPAPCGRGARPP